VTGHGAKYGRKQEEAIAALLVQRNVEEAAKSINVAPKTLIRWMKLPDFQTAYREARRADSGTSIDFNRRGLAQEATAGSTPREHQLRIAPDRFDGDGTQSPRLPNVSYLS
jgi:hypothetical protein